MEWIEGRKHAPACLGRVLVLGLGKSGRAAVNYCLDRLGNRIDELYIAAGEARESSQVFAKAAQERGAQVAFGDNGVVALAEKAAVPAQEQGQVQDQEHAQEQGQLCAQVATLEDADVSERGSAHAGSSLTSAAETPVFDLCIASPGISQFNYLYQSAERTSREVISEVEFAWRESATTSRWLAITGTNGKTTTTSLIAHVFLLAGERAAAVGNIGSTCIGAVARGDVDVYVVELSSYQLVSTRLFAPNVAVVLNITPDHLKWHRSFEAYVAAKFKLLQNLSTLPGSVAVLDATNDVVREKVRELHTHESAASFAYIPVGTAEGVHGDMRARCGSKNAAFLSEDGFLSVAFAGVTHKIMPASDLQIKGGHNVGNALAVASATVAAGVDDAAIAQGLASFAPLEHRIEPCGMVRGVSCYNDSKATNVDATLQALGSFPGDRVLIMLGGDDKGTDLAPLVKATYQHACAAVCYGEARDRFFEAFQELAGCAPSDFSLLRCEHMEPAFDALLGIARPGDIIVLSPACASFDEFSSFEERGRVFKALVAARAKGVGTYAGVTAASAASIDTAAQTACALGADAADPTESSNAESSKA